LIKEQSLSSKKIYTYDQALKIAMVYFKSDELAASTWLNKYAMKDRKGQYLESNPDDMHKRMAREFAKKEKQYQVKKISVTRKKQLSDYGQKRSALTEKKIYELFMDFGAVIPQGSVMSTLGNPHSIASLSNCIVLPEIYDSYGGILYTDQQLAQLFKRRCGIGIDISTLRPSGMFVLNAAGTTSGAVSFMDRFSNTTREVAQNGRRGALMITIDIAHPDAAEFIRIKQDLSKVTGANVSLRISDAFMQAVASGKTFRQRFPIDAGKPLYSKTTDARALWNEIVHCAHHTAEPGILFWDRQHQYSTSSVYPEFRNVSTNPCSEIAMQGGDSCRLIAMNLLHFVKHPFTSDAVFDHERFYQAVYEAQRLMDDLVDLEIEAIDRILKKIKQDPEPASIKQVEAATWELIRNNGKKGRRTGLGFTALADTLAALGMAYDSLDALHVSEEMLRTKCLAEFESSVDMAIERGRFKSFDPRIENHSKFVNMLKKEFPDLHARMMKHGRRNISLSTVAPTGTLSLLSQTSSGIEPVFMLSYVRRRKVNPKDKNIRIDFIDKSGDSWQEFDVYHPGLKRWMEITGETDIRKSPYWGSTASETDWKKRIALHQVIQKYVTHSISSTFNLPEDVSEKTVADIYFEAWKKGLKGVTIYREGSRSGVLIAPNKASNDSAIGSEQPRPGSIAPVGYETGATGMTERLCPSCGDPDGIVYEEGCMKCKSCGYSICSL
jgi:ribonucleoside-diphosphate reductase alpha chain